MERADTDAKIANAVCDAILDRVYPILNEIDDEIVGDSDAADARYAMFTGLVYALAEAGWTEAELLDSVRDQYKGWRESWHDS